MFNRRNFLKNSLFLASGLSLNPLAWGQSVEELNQIIANFIYQLRLEGRISADEKTAWAVSDISKGQFLAKINAENPLQAASMVKPLVIQAYFFLNARNPQKYPISQAVRDDMYLMIVKSKNPATNRMISRCGGASSVQWILRNNAPKIFQNISIVESIPEGGKTYRNKASAGDYTRFLHALWHNKLPVSALLMEYMGMKNHDRISVNTQYIPPHLEVYDKTGSTSMLCGDFGIINYQSHNGLNYPYSFTGIIQKSRPAQNYTSLITKRSQVMRDISDLVYLYIDRHNG